ncbi:MAG: hypothetical protein CMN72_00320 [Sphingomonas sp.]|nr:hypothetical protein [Sphingomonas sp.]|tara:strand:- start:223 stop:753 length:531 start_codon:yes stop_codon:yes gene_type:complete
MNQKMKNVVKAMMAAEEFVSHAVAAKTKIYAMHDIDADGIDLSRVSASEHNQYMKYVSNAEEGLQDEIMLLESKVAYVKHYGANDMLGDKYNGLPDAKQDEAQELADNIEGSLGIILSATSELESIVSGDLEDPDEFDRVVEEIKKEASELKANVSKMHGLSKITMEMSNDMAMEH